MAGRQRDDAGGRSTAADGPDLADVELDETDESDEASELDTPDDDGTERSSEIEQYWAGLDIDVVEIALPRGVGLTLRQYRTVIDEVPAQDEEDDDIDEIDDEDADDIDDEDEGVEDEVKPAAKAGDGAKKPAPITEERDDVLMLANGGELHLFRSAEGLVAFVRSDAPHALRAAATWDELVETIEADLVVPDDEDRYELDLVVDNLRGGRDVWERELIVGAGEIARDVSFACGLTTVQASLAPGTPLDDLDESIRKTGFLARRKLRRIGSEQAALAWRGLIGKMSSAVVWHD